MIFYKDHIKNFEFYVIFIKKNIFLWLKQFKDFLGKIMDSL